MSTSDRDRAGKRHKSDPRSRANPHKPAPKPNPINPRKSRLRSVTRLLAHKSEHMSAPQLVSLQDEETSLRKEIEGIEKKEERSRMIAKYHKIRFFERRKAERRLGRAVRQLREARESKEEGGQRLDEQEAEVRRRRVDLSYAIYFPLEREYVRLYRKRDDGEESVERGDMWGVVEQASEEGKLEDLREGMWFPGAEAPKLIEQSSKMRLNVTASKHTSNAKKGTRHKEGGDTADRVKKRPHNTLEQEEAGNDSEGSGLSFFGDD